MSRASGGRWTLPLAVAGLLLASGCAATQPVTASPSPAGPAATATTTGTDPSTGADLVARREAAGIAGCPASGSATPVSGGLPGIEQQAFAGGFEQHRQAVFAKKGQATIDRHAIVDDDGDFEFHGMGLQRGSGKWPAEQ